MNNAINGHLNALKPPLRQLLPCGFTVIFRTRSNGHEMSVIAPARHTRGPERRIRRQGRFPVPPRCRTLRHAGVPGDSNESSMHYRKLNTVPEAGVGESKNARCLAVVRRAGREPKNSPKHVLPPPRTQHDLATLGPMPGVDDAFSTCAEHSTSTKRFAVADAQESLTGRRAE